jgi:hypothetical protein
MVRRPATLIQKASRQRNVDSTGLLDSIIARQAFVTDLFNSVDPRETFVVAGE